MNRKADIFKKTLAIIVPIVTIIVFILILISGSYLKKHLKSGKQIEDAMLQLEELTSNKSWTAAETQVKILDQAWQNLAPKVQISSEEDDIIRFGNSIKMLKGYIKGEDLGSALAEIGSLRFTWERLGR